MLTRQFLESFYHSPLGLLYQRHIRQILRRMLPELMQKTGGTPPQIACLGHGTPLFHNLPRANLVSCITICPEWLSPVTWPQKTETKHAPHPANQTAQADLLHLPFADDSMDYLILNHSLEFCGHPHQLLRECWRVLAPEGRLILITPHRHSLWARAEHTPLGHGHPYSRRQVQQLLKEQLFQIDELHMAMLMPPFRRRLWMRLYAVIRRAVRGLHSLMPLQWGGVVMLRASKHLYQPVTGTPAHKLAAKKAPNLAKNHSPRKEKVVSIPTG